MRKIKIGLIFTPLILGILIYLLYRSKNLFYYNLIHYLDIHGYVILARKTALIYRKLFPTWAIYSLPDGLWLFSAGAAFLIARRFYFFHTIWYSVLYLIMILNEYLQKFYGGHGTLIGTYDKNDVLAFTIAYISINIIAFILRSFSREYTYKLSYLKEVLQNITYTILFFTVGLLPSLF